MFHLMLALPCLLVLARYVWPMKWPLTLKLLLALVLLAVSQHHLLTRLAFGSMFSPEVPRAVIIGVTWLFGATLLLAVMQLMLDIALAALALVRRRRQSPPAALRYVMGVVALLLAAWSVAQAVRVPPVREVEIAIEDLPPAFEGYQFLHLSDLHISRLFNADWTTATVARANRLNPDLILISGDLIDGDLAVRRPDVAPLEGLSAPDGVLASPGNHEYYFGYRQWMAHYESLGIEILANRHVTLERDGQALVIAGVTDTMAPSLNLPAPNLEQTLDGAPADAPVILLDHQPKNAARGAAAGVALQLSGHTHGGMMVGLDRIVARLNEGFVSGRYELGDMTLYVNNGTALWPGFALRLGVPSELTRITLTGTQK